MSTLRANTLKPITSGNSLVLQGDSGGSGVSGPSIDSNGDVDFSQNTNAKVKLPSGGGIYESDGSTEILTESSGLVTLKNTTIDSNVTFPAGSLINYDFFEVTGTVNTSTTTNATPVISSITPISITLPAGSTAIISASGGKLYASNGTTRKVSVALLSYTTDGTTPSASSNLIYGAEATLVSPSGTCVGAGFVEGEVTNSTASDQTLKFNYGVVGTGAGAGQWESETGARATISLRTLIFKD